MFAIIITGLVVIVKLRQDKLAWQTEQLKIEREEQRRLELEEMERLRQEKIQDYISQLQDLGYSVEDALCYYTKDELGRSQQTIKSKTVELTARELRDLTFDEFKLWLEDENVEKVYLIHLERLVFFRQREPLELVSFYFPRKYTG